jgi:hypothetical protein
MAPQAVLPVLAFSVVVHECAHGMAALAAQLDQERGVRRDKVTAPRMTRHRRHNRQLAEAPGRGVDHRSRRVCAHPAWRGARGISTNSCRHSL